MFNKKLGVLVATLLLSLSAASNANQPVESTAPATVATVNPFGSQTLPSISGELKFNAAHPGAWMSLVDPASHDQMHSTPSSCNRSFTWSS